MKKRGAWTAARLRAFWRLLRCKMLRDPLPPRRVAAGWAIGMFIGCSIPFGFQLVISIPLAIATKTSKIGATVATLITNPATIVFIYPAQTVAVHKLVFGCCPKLPEAWTFETLKTLAGSTIACFLAGGLLLGCILAPATYIAVLGIVSHHRRMRKAKALERKEAKA